ncbi:MAG: hypothetical protein H0V26_12520 [Solirubrobacterales bacterium]|nr:hypothetical protein [Solirubrobacterales bacterium]
MHPLIHLEHARVDASERLRRASRHNRVPPRPKPPPLRGRAAHATGRLARRLDAEAARRAVV